MDIEHAWPDFSPAHQERLAEIFAQVVGKTVRLDIPCIPSGDVDFTIDGELGFSFVLGNYSVEAERRAGRSLQCEESVMGAGEVLRERLGL